MSEEQIRKEFETWVMENCRRSGQHLQRSSSGLYMDNRVASKWTSYFAAASSSQDRIAQLEADLADAKKDQARLDWLESQCVEVRTPLLHGSLAKFHAQQISDDCEPHKTDLRAQVDAAIKEQGK